MPFLRGCGEPRGRGNEPASSSRCCPSVKLLGSASRTAGTLSCTEQPEILSTESVILCLRVNARRVKGREYLSPLCTSQKEKQFVMMPEHQPCYCLICLSGFLQGLHHSLSVQTHMLSAAKRTNLKKISHHNSLSRWNSLNRYIMLLLTHIDIHKNASHTSR